LQYKLEIAKLMSTKISHSGIIEGIEGDCVKVRIVQTSACAACKVAGYCNAAESKEKIVDVLCGSAAKNLTVGQPVTVTTSGQVAAKALLWGFGLPFVVLVTVLVLVLWLTDHEGTAALSGLAALIPYYILLWLLRDRMREQLAFAIE
jgi:sigma-E factor negative regulatory protein RseC